MLDYNQEAVDPFFTSGRDKDIDVYYLSQIIFQIAKKNHEKQREHNNFLKQTWTIKQNPTQRKLDNLNRHGAGFDKSYDNFEKKNVEKQGNMKNITILTLTEKKELRRI